MPHEYEWFYLRRGQRTHARQRRSGGLDWTARCGTTPLWYEPNPGWQGTGSQFEYDTVAILPRCVRCTKLIERDG